VPISFQLRIAAQFIAIVGLASFYAEGATAQTAPQLRIAALGSPETAAEHNLALSQEPSRHVIAGSPLQTRIDLGLAQSLSQWTRIGSPSKSRNAVGAAGYGRLDVVSNFIAAYQSLRKLLDVRAPSLVKKYAALTSTAIVGAASIYNPYRDRPDSNKQTASGELYNPAAWTAAIQLDLRGQFRGVRYGKNYQPAYALVESGEKGAIVRINDVGPLGVGRVIDLNERSMRYFDPTLQRGLIGDVKVTLLPGESWTPGPIDREQPLNVASAQ
jgi:rare lipoprotein A